MTVLLAKLGAEFLVNAATSGFEQYDHTITSLASGGFMVSWSEFGGEGTLFDVKAQIFDAMGARSGTEFFVNTAMVFNQQESTITSLASGGFVVSWSDQSGQGGDASGFGIKAQIFDATGARSGSEFLVNTATLSEQSEPTIASLASGGFVVSWIDYSGLGGDASDRSIKAQIFDATGMKSGPEFLVNSATLGEQLRPTITSLASGGVVVSWYNLGGEIKAQMFQPNDGSISDIGISTLQVSETAIENLSVATLSAVGAVGRTFSYTLLDDSSDGAFRIEGNQLIIDDARKLDFETAPEVNVTIRATDTFGNVFDEVFALDIVDVANEVRFSATGEFLVNTATFDNPYEPTITSLASGGFVVSWGIFGDEGGDTISYGIKAQIFDAIGIKSGSEFLVNTTTFWDQEQPTITSLASGGFVVSWTDSSGQGGDGVVGGYGIKAQLVDAAGVKSGSEFLVNTTTFGTQWQPTITSLASGGFVVNWSDSSGQGGDESYGIKAQIFDATGAKSGSEFLVNTTTLNYQSEPTITSLASGGFVVSWHDYSGQGGDASASAIKAQIFDASGAKSGTEFLVNTATLSEQSQPTITSLASGGFVISWSDYSGLGGDASGSGIKAQIFDATGAKSGPEFLVNTATLNQQIQPTITSLASGGFVVSWTDDSRQGGDASSFGIKAQIFDATGTKSGSEFLVNTEALGFQGQPTITSLSSGGFVVSWADSSDASGSSIKAQIFNVIPNAAPTDLTLSAAAIDENAAAGTFVGSGSAIDPDSGDSFTYALLDDAGGRFVIDSASGALLVADGSLLDAEAATAHAIAVRVTDSGGLSFNKAFIISVNDINEAPPVISSNGGGASAALSIIENQTAVTTVTAADPDVGAAISYSLAGGDDAALFTIDAVTGVLAFASAPNFEAQADVGGDNIYDVIVRASDGTLFDDQALAITIANDANETFTGTALNDTLTGTGDNDILIGLAGNDSLSGGMGDDLLNGGLGNDILNGGEGGDTVSYANATRGVAVNLGVTTAQGTIEGKDTLISIESILGSAFADTLRGNADANTLDGGLGADNLFGFGGSDLLIGGGGNDKLDGGSGADTLDGGSGNDTYVVDDSSDVIIEGLGAGTDTVNANTSFILGSNIEKLTLTGLGDIDGIANTLANTLTGNDGNNILSGLGGKDILIAGAGNDTLIGGAGADVLTGGTGEDVFVFDSLTVSADKDTIRDFTPDQDSLMINRSVFAAFATDAAGALSASNFTVGAKATTLDHHLIYNSATGTLFYDVDGSGALAQIQIAQMAFRPLLSGSDFFLG